MGKGTEKKAGSRTTREGAQGVLRESEGFFRALIENSIDAITALNADGTIRYASSSFERMLGIKPEEETGKSGFDHVHRDDLAKAADALAQLVHDPGAIVHQEVRVQHADGSWHYLEVIGKNLLDDPAVRGIVGSFRDITDWKRAEDALRDSEEQYRQLVELSPDAIAVHSEGKIVYINTAGATLLGAANAEQLIGKPITDFVHPDYRKTVEDRLRELREEGKRVPLIEEKFVRLDGTDVDVEVAAIPVTYRGKPAVQAVVRDITERKQAREALQKARDELEMRVKERTLGLTQANKALRAEIRGRKRMEDALRREEEYFRALTENSLDFIAVLNSDGSVRYESPSVERVLGYRPEERIGKSGLEHIHPEDMSEAANLLVRLVETPGTTVRVQSRFRHKDGSWRVLDVVAQNLLDNPVVAGIVANMRDVTEQNKAEQALRESEHNYRVLFESTIDGAAVIDAETMKVVLANETAAKMYGFDSMEEVVEANLVDYVHPDDRERALTTLAEDLFEKDLRRVEEFRTLTKDDGVRWIAGVGTRVEYQGRLAGLISFRDITEQKRMDEKLRELYEQERESRQQLEAEMKKRVEFTRALAHELKTPLTSVLASSDLLESELREEPLQTLARSIRQGASNLNSRIDELLDLARGEVGMLQLKLEWVDMSKLLRETAESMIPLASRRGQSLVIALPLSLPPVRADAARLQQIVANLLSNALKFTPVGGNIKLGAKQKDAALVVEVRDMGRGIPKEDQKFLFEPYHRLQTEPSGGLGLGLALCRMLVELHGGQIWVRSQVGKGSTFGFSLPLETADKQAEGLEKPPKLWTVLIIEDDQNIVSTVSVAFQMRWPEAELVSTVMGEEGLHLVETENPDLVILDLGLPDIDGFDVLRRLRLFSTVPVVILTVRGDEADKVKGVELGADDYVVKPFKPQELLTRLKAQLRKSISP